MGFGSSNLLDFNIIKKLILLFKIYIGNFIVYLFQFLAMGADQRNAIRKALNEDANKLLREGDPADPQLRRLKREMDEVNRLFDEFERRSQAEEDGKNLTRMFTEQVKSIQISLDDFEHTLNTRLSAPIPRDMDTLEHLVIQHKDFETSLKVIY